VIEEFLAQLTDWAVARRDVLGVALVGSHARGAAQENSDVDVVVFTATPLVYTTDVSWAQRFGRVANHQIETWGRVTSVRVWFESGLEVEFGFASPEWAAEPLEEGTSRVVASGLRVLMDRDGVLAHLAGG
jgi:predicted nucleotidyltransferase